jgi:hypothetical protein
MERQACTGSLLCASVDEHVLLECTDCGWIGTSPDDRHIESLVLPHESVPA